MYCLSPICMLRLITQMYSKSPAWSEFTGARKPHQRFIRTRQKGKNHRGQFVEQLESKPPTRGFDDVDKGMDGDADFTLSRDVVKRDLIISYLMGVFVRGLKQPLQDQVRLLQPCNLTKGNGLGSTILGTEGSDDEESKRNRTGVLQG